MRVLVVEDDPLLGEAICIGMRQRGFAADWVRDGIAADMALKTETFAAVILDLGLPRLSGMQLLRQRREAHDGTPVLILTARDAIQERVQGLDAGADDYVVKPVDLDELAARLRALVRRSGGDAQPLLQVGALRIDPGARHVDWHDAPVELSPREFDLLLEFARSPNRFLSKEQLTERLYGWNDEVESNALEVHIHHLRRKLDPSLIVTQRGVGYMLRAEPL
ncbi:MAG: response regulator transcription factor [Xanthomonadales bacterium]|nr:response regulator transcription factor [Xanthomonadales bacterium]